jgi:hypothetical protein
MTKLKDSKDFDFYAKEFPIIKDEGWEEGLQAFGTIQFRKTIPFEYQGRPCSYTVGIIVRPTSWNYCYRALLYNCPLRGDNLDIALNAPHEQVYAKAKEEAIKQIDAKLKEWEDEVDDFED